MEKAGNVTAEEVNLMMVDEQQRILLIEVVEMTEWLGKVVGNPSTVVVVFESQ